MLAKSLGVEFDMDAAWDEKKKTLRRYSSLNITTDYLDGDGWDETSIYSRARDLAELAVEMWAPL